MDRTKEKKKSEKKRKIFFFKKKNWESKRTERWRIRWCWIPERFIAYTMFCIKDLVSSLSNWVPFSRVSSSSSTPIEAAKQISNKVKGLTLLVYSLSCAFKQAFIWSKVRHFLWFKILGFYYQIALMFRLQLMTFKVTKWLKCPFFLFGACLATFTKLRCRAAFPQTIESHVLRWVSNFFLLIETGCQDIVFHWKI